MRDVRAFYLASDTIASDESPFFIALDLDLGVLLSSYSFFLVYLLEKITKSYCEHDDSIEIML